MNCPSVSVNSAATAVIFLCWDGIWKTSRENKRQKKVRGEKHYEAYQEKMLITL